MASRGEGVYVRRWLHRLCVSPFEHNYVTVGTCEVREGTRGKINVEKTECLWFSSWGGGVPLLRPFNWSDWPIRILGIWFDPDLQQERNWSEVQVKVSLVEVYTVYIFSLILYRLFVLHLPMDWGLALELSLFSFLLKGRKLMVCKHVCCQRPCNGGLGIPDLTSYCCRELKETAENAFYDCERVRPLWDYVWEVSIQIDLK